jgi:hypothetical protein
MKKRKKKSMGRNEGRKKTRRSTKERGIAFFIVILFLKYT